MERLWYSHCGKQKEIPQKLRIEVTYDPGTPLPGIYPKHLKTFICKDRCAPKFTAALFTVAKTWKQLKCPLIGDWTRKMWSLYTMEYHSAIRKDEILPLVTTWMDPESTMLSKISQKEKIKKHAFTHMWDIKQTTNEQTRQINKQTLIDNSTVVTRGGAASDGQRGSNVPRQKL